MAKRSKKAKPKTIGAFGEDLETNQPVQPLPLAPGPIEDKPKVPEPPVASPKEQPKTWPFNKSNVGNEKKEMAHVSRLVNMKHDNPGIKTITKTVTYDCEGRKIACKYYEIKY